MFAARSSARLCAAALLSLAFTGASQAGTPRLFTARLNIVETITFTGTTPCFGYSSLQGSGNSLPLGAVTLVSQDCVNPQGVFDPARPNFSFSSLPGTLSFTAQNGDRVFVTYSGVLNVLPTGKHALTGHFVITGGTGAYFGATGGGTLLGTEDLSQGTSANGVINALGTINY